jgi:hypothetical protein
VALLGIVIVAIAHARGACAGFEVVVEHYRDALTGTPASAIFVAAVRLISWPRKSIFSRHAIREGAFFARSRTDTPEPTKTKSLFSLSTDLLFASFCGSSLFYVAP